MKRTIAGSVLSIVLVPSAPAGDDAVPIPKASASVTASQARATTAHSVDASSAASSRSLEEPTPESAPASTASVAAPALTPVNVGATAAPQRGAGSAQAARAAEEIPLHWAITGSNTEGYELRTDRAVVLSGSASGVLESYSDTDTSRFGALIQIASAVPFKGKRIELSGYIASLDAPAGAALWMRADDANGAVVAFENTGSRGIRGTQEWTYQNIVMDIPKEAVALVYGAVLNGRGKLYVDDLQFRVVDAKVAVPAKPITPQRSLARGTIADPGREPRNLDFEETRVKTE